MNAEQAKEKSMRASERASEREGGREGGRERRREGEKERGGNKRDVPIFEKDFAPSNRPLFQS